MIAPPTTRQKRGDSSPPSSSSLGQSAKAVVYLRFVLLAVLVGSTITCATLVYKYASDAEQTQFEDHFQSESAVVMDALLGSLFLSLGAFDSFVLDMMSYANSANATWPFVTIPNFGVRAAKIRSLSKAILLFQYIWVSAIDRPAWESFSLQNDGWVNEILELQQRDEHFHGTGYPDYVPYGRIHGQNGNSPESASFFLPSWQTYPIVPERPPYNWDGALVTAVQQSLDCLVNDTSVVIKVVNLPDESDPIAVRQARYTNDWARDFITDDQDPAEPMVNVYYPMSTGEISSLSGKESVREDNSSSLVGIFTARLYWRELLVLILPPGTGGVVVVFEMGDYATFTYAIDGPEANYLGRGDCHNTKYKGSLEQSLVLGQSIAAAKGVAYSGLPLCDTTSNFKIRIYPSTSMEEAYLTRGPFLYTVVAVLAFLFTSTLFVIYDQSSEKRQQKALHTVEQTEQNVALLEDMVQERTRELEESNARIEAASAKQLQHFASMSHEIRTPMNGIIGLSSLLEETELSPLQAETMKMITASGNLLVCVVNDVLDYAKLQSGFVDIQKTKSKLQEVMSSTAYCVQLKSKGGVTIETFYDPQIPEHFTTDTRRLQQILFNLLGNAVKFSSEGGTVEFHASICDTKLANLGGESRFLDVEARGKPLARTLRFVVKDYGRGIKREDLKVIFEPFSQAGKDTAGAYGGTGLGLAITMRLVHALGGAISVDSEFGKWSEFTVDLPFCEELADIEAEALRLQSIQVVLVGQESRETGWVTQLFHRFGVSVFRYQHLRDIEIKAAVIKVPNSQILYLVHEDSFAKSEFEALAEDSYVRLATFGPNFSVPESRFHYRSLTNILPVVLFRQIREYAQDEMTQASSQAGLESRSVSKNTNVEIRKDLRFLIAEDNSVNQKVLKRILTRLGFEHIDIVEDGQAAVEAEARSSYDLIWMDMQMPHVDGVEACRIINSRRTRSRRVPKIVFCTAHVQDKFEKECLDSGAIGFLAKPCSIQTVKACLESIAHHQDFDPQQDNATP
uniref:Histidine kinase n=1 Tax=Amphora coffeiformis TaxID=265554 RepID=A0A7S3LHI2_9STRA